MSATIRSEMEHIVVINDGTGKKIVNVAKIHENGNMVIWYRGIKGTIHLARKDKRNFPKLNLKNWLTGKYESFMVKVY